MKNKNQNDLHLESIFQPLNGQTLEKLCITQNEDMVDMKSMSAAEIIKEIQIT